jgi:hypothetical protein
MVIPILLDRPAGPVKGQKTMGYKPLLWMVTTRQVASLSGRLVLFKARQILVSLVINHFVKTAFPAFFRLLVKFRSAGHWSAAVLRRAGKETGTILFPVQEIPAWIKPSVPGFHNTPESGQPIFPGDLIAGQAARALRRSGRHVGQSAALSRLSSGSDTPGGPFQSFVASRR